VPARRRAPCPNASASRRRTEVCVDVKGGDCALDPSRQQSRHRSRGVDAEGCSVVPERFALVLTGRRASVRTYSYISEVAFKTELWTDGACSGNPGPGGWAFVLVARRWDGMIIKQLEGRGGEQDTTNNRMEMSTVLQGLGALSRATAVTISPDSSYLTNAFVAGWLVKWQRNGWKSGRKPVKNQDLWLALLEAVAPHCVDGLRADYRDHGEAGVLPPSRGDMLVAMRGPLPLAVRRSPAGRKGAAFVGDVRGLRRKAPPGPQNLSEGDSTLETSRPKKVTVQSSGPAAGIPAICSESCSRGARGGGSGL
jgi:ribonuclease HI